MIQPNQFRYTLNIRNGTKFYVLPVAPIGWDKNIIKYTRNETYYGLLRDFSAPLEFVKQGAELLRREWYRYKSKANVKLILEKLQSDWSYKEVYNGPLDFTTVTESDTSFVINAKADGISENVKAYADANYEISVDTPLAKTITIPTVRLIESADLIFQTDLSGKGSQFPAISVVNNEQKGTNASVKDVAQESNNAPNFATSDKWFFQSNATTRVTFTESELNVFINPGDGGFDVSLYNQTGAKLYTAFNSTSVQGDFTINLNCAVNVSPGDKLFWYISRIGSNAFKLLNIADGKLSPKYFTTSPPTQCRVLPAKYIMDKLMELMNDGIVPTQSSLLSNTLWNRLYITCGDEIRQLKTKTVTDADGNTTTIDATPVVKINWADYFQSINAVLNVEFEVRNNTAILEAKAAAYQQTAKAFSVSGTKDVKFAYDTSKLFNTIKGGYVTQTYDEINGKDEFNAATYWQLPLNKVEADAKELDLQSKIRADMYGITFLQINLSQKDSIDSDSDNDSFFIFINEELTAPEGSDELTSFTGIAAGNTVYNWRISPKRNLLRHGDYLHGLLQGLEAYSIKFTSGDKNYTVSTTDSSGYSVVENADIPVINLPPALFMPITANFTCDFHTLDYLDAMPNGYIEFKRKNKLYKGFIVDIGVDISKNSAQEYTLLLTADNIL